MISIERKMAQIDVEQIRLQPSQPVPERQDDWFVLSELIGEEAVPLPSGIQLYTLFPVYSSVHGRCSNSSTLSLFVSVAPAEITPDMRKLHEFEAKTTETIAWKRTVIGTDSRRDETRLTEIRPISAPLERGGGDDWFVWFDAIREKPVVAPPGTFPHQKNSHFSSCRPFLDLYTLILHVLVPLTGRTVDISHLALQSD